MMSTHHRTLAPRSPVDDILVEEASPADFTGVRALLMLAHADHQRVVARGSFSSHLHDLLDLESRLGVSTLLVARRRGRLVGTATYFPDGSRQLPGWPAGWASVSGLAVVPQARGQGVATRLMGFCLDRARADGAPVFGVHATDFMKPAVTLAWRLGFRRATQYDYQIPHDLLDGLSPPRAAFGYVRVL